MENNTAQLQKVEIKTNPAYLLQLAIEKGVDVQQLEKLLALQERWQKTQAEKEFNLAMSNFQKNCPVIKKKNAVKGKDGKERYKFANIGDIVAQTKDEISANKLFYDFKTEDSKEFMKIICTVTHEAGHSKSTDFTIPIGKEDYMTDVQKYGARLSFGKRYAFCNAFGITTGDEDTDAVATEKKSTEVPQATKDELLLMTSVAEFDKYCQDHCKEYLRVPAFRTYASKIRTQLSKKK